VKRAAKDKERFDTFKSLNPVSEISHKGYVQWQGSEAQELLRHDIKVKKHEKMSKIDLRGSRVESISLSFLWMPSVTNCTKSYERPNTRIH
jgi:hypothetical protein